MDKSSKQSKIEQRVNKYIIFIMLMQFSLCLITGIGSWFFIRDEAGEHKYLRGLDYSATVQGVLSYFTYFLLLNTMLPISLIVSLELLKVSQGYFMANDTEMYSSLRDRTCKVSSYSITEELGMIQHIFSDKTGTLTCNRMEFKFCSIGNKVYGDQRFFQDLNFTSESSYSTREIIFTFNTKAIVNDLFSKTHSNQKLQYPIGLGVEYQEQLLEVFVKCMALCHECLIDYEGGVLKYIGQSPDEITLVDAARHIGFEYNSIKNNIITLKVIPIGVDDCEEKYERLCLMEFDSDRKRNSIIVRNVDTGDIIMYIKGADNVIRTRLHNSNSQKYIEKIDEDLVNYSRRGLRTLLLAYKLIPQHEFQDWKRRFDLANLSIDNRQGRINDLAEEIETDLFLLGCTAVEDALQDEVPATIKSIIQAGIKMWMLTGDKLETAINIGKTCGLLDQETKVFTCSENNLEKCSEILIGIARKSKQVANSALVIEGSSLEIVLYDHKDKEKVQKYPIYSSSTEASELAKNCRMRFIEIAGQCSTLICCRVTPGQKREVVKLMKKETKCISLAIGDGANDVSMILEADVGIGIYGEEGAQAIQACDYGLGEFKFLWELLLVHGRYNYMRVSEMILYFFYKNMVFTMPQFFFGFYCGFSGKSVYDDWYITLYNMAFTALPLMTRAFFEKDILIPKRNQIVTYEDRAIRALTPLVYSLGRNNEIFTSKMFLIWFCTGIFHSCLVFFIPLYSVQAGVIDGNGHNADFWVFSITSFTCVIFIVNLKLALHTRLWNRIHILSISILSIGLYVIFMIIYDIYSPTPSRGSVLQIISTPYFYVIIIVVVALVFICDGGVRIFTRSIGPTKSELLMDYSIQHFCGRSDKRIPPRPSKIDQGLFTTIND